MLNDIDSSDIKFIFPDEEPIYVHKETLSKCSYFNKMFNSGLSEQNTLEISIDHYSRNAVYYILEYIYSGKVNESIDFNDLNFLYEVIDIATMYLLSNLLVPLLHLMEEKVTISDHNMIYLLKISKIYNIKSLEQKILPLISNISHKVLSDHSIEDIKFILSCMSPIMKYKKIKEFIDESIFDQLVHLIDLSEFSIYDIFTHVKNDNIFSDSELLNAVEKRYFSIKKSTYLRKCVGVVNCTSRTLNNFTLYIEMFEPLNSSNTQISIGDQIFMVRPEYYNKKKMVVKLLKPLPIRGGDNIYTMEYL